MNWLQEVVCSSVCYRVSVVWLLGPLMLCIRCVLQYPAVPYTARPRTGVGPQPSRCGLTMTVLLLLASWLSVQKLALLMMLNIIRKKKKYVI